MRSSTSIIVVLCAFITFASALPSADITLTLSPLESRKDRNGTAGGGNSINRTCKKLSKLEKITQLAANQTHLDDLITKGKLTTEEVDALKAKAANSTTELATMTSNATLVSECAAVNARKRVQRQCKTMAKLAKLTSIANNQTAIDALAADKSLNSTQVEKLQEKIANAVAKLQTMQSNTTLTDLCAQMKQQKGSAEDGDGSQEGTQAPATASTSAGTKMVAQTAPLIAGAAVLFAVLL